MVVVVLEILVMEVIVLTHLEAFLLLMVEEVVTG